MSMIWGLCPLIPAKAGIRRQDAELGPPLRGDERRSIVATPRRFPGRRRSAPDPLTQAAARRKAGEAMEELIPGPQHEAERPRHAVAADRELAHGLGHLPNAVAAGWEEGHVARAEPVDFAVLGSRR